MSGVLDAVEQYVQAATNAVRARERFTSYPARDAAGEKVKKKRAAMLDVIDTLRAQLEAERTERIVAQTALAFAKADARKAEARAEAAEAKFVAMRERMHFLAVDGCVEGFVNVKLDIYDYASDSAEESGRDEPNGDDLINGLCRLIDAARTKEDAE